MRADRPSTASVPAPRTTVRTPAPHYPDPGILPNVFAAPCVHLEPGLAFVLDDGKGRAAGYVLGAADTPRFARDFRAAWLPLVADRRPEPDGLPGAPDEEMVWLLRHPERMTVPGPAAYPAHLHIDLLPRWRGRGYGRKQMRRCLEALHDRGVPSVHLVTAKANSSARAFYDRMGFHEIEALLDDSVICLGRSTRDHDRF